MATVQPIQSVNTKAETFALELAQMLADGQQKEASAKLKTFAADNKLVFWEAAAIADIASAMFHGKRWKKGA